jgi:protein-tyrosine phosphatase
MPTSKKSKAGRAKTRPKSPSEIAPGVFVGGWKDAIDFKGTRFCVLDEAPPDMPPATHVQIYDGTSDQADSKSLDRLAEAIRGVQAKGEPVLVFCGHGIRRSPLAGAWYLRRTQGLTLDEAFDRVRAVRPKVEHAREWVGNAVELERA